MGNKAILMTVTLATLMAAEACTHRPFDLKPATTPITECKGVTPTFQKDIQPIFKAGCAKAGCHDGNSMPHDFSIYGEIKPGLDDSAIYYYVIKDRTMPQDTALSATDLNTIKCWFAGGCPEQ